MQLTEESKINYNEILNFIKNNKSLINKYLNDINLDYYSKSDKIKKTFNTLKYIYSDSIKIDYQTKEIDQNKREEIKNKYLENIDGFSNKNSHVYTEFKRLNNETVANIEIPIGGKQLDFLIRMIHQNNSSDLTYVKNIIKRVQVLLSYGNKSSRMRNLAKIINSKNDKFQIIIILIPINRSTNLVNNKRGDWNTKQGIYNCSSGYTFLFISKDSFSGEILCTKRPEILGLITHEIGHLLGWDGSILCKKNEEYFFYIPKMREKDINKLNGLCLHNNDLALWEVLDNINTTLIHSMCNSIEMNDNFDKFIDLFQIEIIYSLYHTAKILYAHGFNKYQDLFIGDNGCNNIYQQKARLFEYTIARSIMFKHYPEILNQYEFTDNRITFNLPSVQNEIMNCDYGAKITPITKLYTIIIDSINESKVNKIYVSIINKFINHLKDNYGDIKEINMEYFCFDLDKKINQKGGNEINYYALYRAMKKKYITLKKRSQKRCLKK